MLSAKITRSLLAVFLTCMVALSGFVSPAFANTGSTVESLVESIGEGIGTVIGGAIGTVIVCYTSDALIASFFPPAALYLTPMCAALGATAGGVSGAVAAKTVIGQK